jgi:hypothetical protein
VTEKEPLERREQLLAAKGPSPGLAAVRLGDDAVVLERSVRGLERILELIALPDVVVLPRFDRRAQVRVDHATDRPQGSRPTFDPDHDTLLATGVVQPFDDSLGKAACRVPHLHGARV